MLQLQPGSSCSAYAAGRTTNDMTSPCADGHTCIGSAGNRKPSRCVTPAAAYSVARRVFCRQMPGAATEAAASRLHSISSSIIRCMLIRKCTFKCSMEYSLLSEHAGNDRARRLCSLHRLPTSAAGSIECSSACRATTHLLSGSGVMLPSRVLRCETRACWHHACVKLSAIRWG